MKKIIILAIILSILTIPSITCKEISEKEQNPNTPIDLDKYFIYASLQEPANISENRIELHFNNYFYIHNYLYLSNCNFETGFHISANNGRGYIAFSNPNLRFRGYSSDNIFIGIISL